MHPRERFEYSPPMLAAILGCDAVVARSGAKILDGSLARRKQQTQAR